MAATPTAAAAPAASAPVPSYFHKSLAGKIGDKYSVTFDLKNVDGVLSGTYRYDNRRTSATVHDERLYLQVRDGVDYSDSLSGSFEAAVSDILVVSYSVVDHQFELLFIEGECCGSTQWTFGPRKP